MEKHFPEIEGFEKILETITIRPPEKEEKFERVEILEKKQGYDENHHYVEYPQIDIWVKPYNNFTIDSVIRKINEILTKNNHKANDEIAKIILAIFALHPRRDSSHIIALNELLDQICEVNVMMWYVLPINAPLDYRLELDDFTLGRIDTEKIQYWCNKIKSDYYLRYGQNLVDKFAIERKLSKVNVINWLNVCEKWKNYLVAGSNNPDIYETLVLSYFEAINKNLFSEFWTCFLNNQHLYIALGNCYLNGIELQKILRCQMISIFSEFNVEGVFRGYIVPLDLRTLNFNLGKTDERINNLRNNLKSEYRFEKYSDAEIHQVIKTFVLFISKAKRNLLSGQKAEGFLHFVIALDLLLGEREALNKSIINRASLLVFKKLGNSFNEQRNILKNIYEKRSRYVHSGKEDFEDALQEVEKNVEEILYCILRLQKNKDNHGEGFLTKWLKNLDHMIAAIEAEKDISDGEFIENGISV